MYVQSISTFVLQINSIGKLLKIDRKDKQYM